jgi:hypothetical protein
MSLQNTHTNYQILHKDNPPALRHRLGLLNDVIKLVYALRHVDHLRLPVSMLVELS